MLIKSQMPARNRDDQNFNRFNNHKMQKFFWSQCAMLFHSIVRVCVFAKKKTRIALIVILATMGIVFVVCNDNLEACCSKNRTQYLWGSRYIIYDSRKDGYRFYSRTEDMIVRAVFLDDRPRYGHQSVTVFLMEMRKTMIERNLIVECTVGRYQTDNFTIFQLSLNTWLHTNRSYLTHDFVLLECYDLPPVDNGSVAFITYNTSVSTQNDPCKKQTKSVISERPLYISPLYKPPTDGRKYNFRVAVCLAVVYESPPWLNEWLRYQKAIGIDHIHMIADDTFEKAGGFKNEYLQQLIQEGFLSTDIYHAWLNSSQVWGHSQGLAYQDCVYRFRYQYDYMFMLDTDDFFVPAVSGEPKVPYYIQKYYSYTETYTFDWVHFYPDCGMKGELPDDGNITKQLVSKQCWDHIRKSLHYLPHSLDVNVHTRGRMLHSDLKSIYIPKKVAYVAHVRKGRKPKNGC